MSTAFLISYFALWALVVVLVVALIALYQHFGQMYMGSREGRSMQGPADGASLPPIRIRPLNGELEEFPSPQGVPAVLVFAETTCTVCGHRRPDLERFAAEQDKVRVLVICGGPTEDAVRRWSDGMQHVEVIPDVGMKFAIHYGIGITPFTVAVDRAGAVRAKGLLNDYDALLLYGDMALLEPDVAAAA